MDTEQRRLGKDSRQQESVDKGSVAGRSWEHQGLEGRSITGDRAIGAGGFGLLEATFGVLLYLESTRKSWRV